MCRCYERQRSKVLGTSGEGRIQGRGKGLGVRNVGTGITWEGRLVRGMELRVRVMWDSSHRFPLSLPQGPLRESINFSLMCFCEVCHENGNNDRWILYRKFVTTRRTTKS